MTNSPTERVPRLRPEQLTDEQRRLYDELLHGPRGQGRQFFELTEADGVLTGPFNAMLASPRVGTAVQRLGAALRYHGGLPDQARELVILVVAAHLGSAFEWHAHEPPARHFGVADEVIAALRDGRPPRLADQALRAAHDLAVALLSGEDVPDERYAVMAGALGVPGVFEVSAIVGYYWLLAAQLRLFRAEPPAPADARPPASGPGTGAGARAARQRPEG
jgi:4-carboxymuconolactone decarboxylase